MRIAPALLFLVVIASCVDTTTDVVIYGEPCGTAFGRLLLCDRGTGGADLVGDDGESQGDPCRIACDRFNDCGFLDPEDYAACPTACSSDPQAVAALECINNALSCNGILACLDTGN